MSFSPSLVFAFSLEDLNDEIPLDGLASSSHLRIVRTSTGGFKIDFFANLEWTIGLTPVAGTVQFQIHENNAQLPAGWMSELAAKFPEAPNGSGFGHHGGSGIVFRVDTAEAARKDTFATAVVSGTAPSRTLAINLWGRDSAPGWLYWSDLFPSPYTSVRKSDVNVFIEAL